MSYSSVANNHIHSDPPWHLFLLLHKLGIVLILSGSFCNIWSYLLCNIHSSGIFRLHGDENRSYGYGNQTLTHCGIKGVRYLIWLHLERSLTARTTSTIVRSVRPMSVTLPSTAGNVIVVWTNSITIASGWTIVWAGRTIVTSFDLFSQFSHSRCSTWLLTWQSWWQLSPMIIMCCGRLVTSTVKTWGWVTQWSWVSPWCSTFWPCSSWATWYPST